MVLLFLSFRDASSHPALCDQISINTSPCIANRTATVNVLSQRIDELEREKDRLNDAMGKHVFTLDSRITREIDNLKEDLEHKFALQVAENKRLLNQLVKQKNEAGAMRKYIEALEERIRLLQDEMGV